MSGTLRLNTLEELRVPFEGVVRFCFLPERTRLSLTCKGFWSTISTLPFTCEQHAIENKQVSVIARSLGLVLGRSSHCQKYGSKAGLLLRRLCESYFLHVLPCSDLRGPCADVRKRIAGPTIRAFILELLRERREIKLDYFLKNGATILHAAVLTSDFELLKAVIDNGSFARDLHDSLTTYRQSALLLACERSAKCALLLARSFQWQWNPDEEENPFFYACLLARRARCGSDVSPAVAEVEELVTLLIQQEPRWVSTHCFGLLPIHVPTTPRIIRSLCDAKADPNSTSSYRMVLDRRFGVSPLLLHAALPDNVAALLAVGADPRPLPPRSPTAAEKFQQQLFPAKAVPGQHEKPTALHLAAALSSESTRLLLQAGAPPDSPAADGCRPLHHAARGVFGRSTSPVWEVWRNVQRSRQPGTGLSGVARGSFSRLRCDCGLQEDVGAPQARAESVQLLVDAGAAGDAMDEDGRTPFEAPLDPAARRGLPRLLSFCGIK